MTHPESTIKPKLNSFWAGWQANLRDESCFPVGPGLLGKKRSEMTLRQAIKEVETMPEGKFQEWFKSLPYRVQLCVGGGIVDWREVLGYWYLKTFNAGGLK